MKDYKQSSPQNSHYSAPSMYGKLVREQYNQQPKYCEPGNAGKMSSSKSKKGM